MPLSGSLKIPISGVIKVNNAKSAHIIHRNMIEYFGFLQGVFCLLNLRVSYIYAIEAEVKKIAMLIQSGDLPITPLYV